jgi:type II secretory pathway pseudopilin PulG
MRSRPRPAFTRVELIVCLAMAGVVLALVLAAVAHFRYEARVTESQQKLKTITEALIDQADRDKGRLPPGLDEKHFSALSKILPLIGEEELYRQIDFSKSIDDPANRAARRTTVNAFLSPLDDPPAPDDPTKSYGPTNYLLNGLVFHSGFPSFYPATFVDGTTQTVMVAETLRGAPTRRPDVRRQHVVLGEKEADHYGARWLHSEVISHPWKAENQNRWDTVGVQEFEAGTNVATNRGASWMDGGALQTVLLPGRGLNDPLPDAIRSTPERMEGVSSPRSMTHWINFSLADGSVRRVDARYTSNEKWFNALTPFGEDAMSPDW